MSSRQIVPVGFFAASALFLLTAGIDAIKGQPFKPAFLVLAVVFALLGAVVRPRSDARR